MSLTSASLQSLDQFYELVLEDTALQEQLQAAPDQESIIKLAVQLGAENGYNFTPEDVREVIERERKGKEIIYPIPSIFEPTVNNY